MSSSPTLLALTVLEDLHGSKGSTASKRLMAEAGVVASVHGLVVVVVVVLVAVCIGKHKQLMVAAEGEGSSLTEPTHCVRLMGFIG